MRFVYPTGSIGKASSAYSDFYTFFFFGLSVQANTKIAHLGEALLLLHFAALGFEENSSIIQEEISCSSVNI